MIAETETSLSKALTKMVNSTKSIIRKKISYTPS
jgi:hypothetical protein